MRRMLLPALWVLPIAAQTRIDLPSQTKRVDFTSATSTRPFKAGTTLPPNCTQGEMFFKTDAPAGANTYGCASPNVWSLQGSGALSCVDHGTSSDYACPLDPPIMVYTAGGSYSFRANTANDGGATINFNGMGPKTIVKQANKALAAGDIRAGQWVVLKYDGTNMQMLSPPGASATGGSPGGMDGQVQYNNGGDFAGIGKTGTGNVASTAGATATEHCAKFDANGNIVDAGGPCSAASAPITISTSGPVVVTNAGFYFNNAAGPLTYNLPAITADAIGGRYCFRNSAGRTGGITLQAPALTYIDKDGSNSTAGGKLASGGAAGDSACVVAMDTTHYVAFTGSGTWIRN